MRQRSTSLGASPIPPPPPLGRTRSATIDPAELAPSPGRKRPFVEITSEELTQPHLLPRVRVSLDGGIKAAMAGGRVNLTIDRRVRHTISIDSRLVVGVLLFAMVSNATALTVGGPLRKGPAVVGAHSSTPLSVSALRPRTIADAAPAAAAAVRGRKWLATATSYQPAVAAPAAPAHSDDELPPTYPAPAPSVAKLRALTSYLGPELASHVCDTALDYAARAHEGQRRKSGEPYIIHPIEVACVLAELRLDSETIVAGLLHDTVEDCPDITSASRPLPAPFPPSLHETCPPPFKTTPPRRPSSPTSHLAPFPPSARSIPLSPLLGASLPLAVDDIREAFGSSVAAIVSGVTDAPKAADADNQRALLLAMSSEWRIALVKLADRLHNMRTLEHMPKHKQVNKAKETLRLFVPLARELGASQLEAELRRLSSSYMYSAPAGLLGTLPGSGMALDGLASLQCPAVLEQMLSADDEMRAVDVIKLRDAWAQHCEQHGGSSQMRLSAWRDASREAEAGDAAGAVRSLTQAAAMAFAAPIVVAAPAVTNAAEQAAQAAGQAAGIFF